MIVLVAHLGDPHAVHVLTQLQRRGARAVLLDTERFPRDIKLTISQARAAGWHAGMNIAGEAWDLTEVRVVWWRRPLPFRLHDEVAETEDRVFAYGECHAAVSGLWSCLDALWINDPDRDQIAARKLLQLKVAARLGLRTPRTCVTNDPEQAKQFVRAEGGPGTIYKSFSATENAWRETRLLRAEEHELLENVRFAPVIFQEHIPATVDLRITIIGDEFFPAEIDLQHTGYAYDFRMNIDEATMKAHRLPDTVRDQLHTLMATMGLVYGAIDMRLTPEGEYVFLEVNPAGQWLFIEQRTGQPISDALCNFMVGHDKAGF